MFSVAVCLGADECGKSKYDDAGEGCPIGTPCSNVVGGMPSRENEFPFQVRYLKFAYNLAYCIQHKRY